MLSSYISVTIGFIFEAIAASALCALIVFYFKNKSNKKKISFSYKLLTVLSVAVLTGLTRMLFVFLIGGKGVVNLDAGGMLGILFFFVFPTLYSLIIYNFYSKRVVV
jgi:hypothetical protein